MPTTHLPGETKTEAQAREIQERLQQADTTRLQKNLADFTHRASSHPTPAAPPAKPIKGGANDPPAPE